MIRRVVLAAVLAIAIGAVIGAVFHGPVTRAALAPGIHAAERHIGQVRIVCPDGPMADCKAVTP